MKYFHLFALMSIAFMGCIRKSESKVEKETNWYVYFVDSVKIDRVDFLEYDPIQTAKITVYNGEMGAKLLGREGRAGVIYIETKSFAKSRYWRYFRNKCDDYAKYILSPESDTIAQYILNDQILRTNFEGELALISDEVFQEIKVIDSVSLREDYGVVDKRIGVVIKSEKFDSVLNAVDNF